MRLIVLRVLKARGRMDGPMPRPTKTICVCRLLATSWIKLDLKVRSRQKLDGIGVNKIASQFKTLSARFESYDQKRRKLKSWKAKKQKSKF